MKRSGKELVSDTVKIIKQLTADYYLHWLSSTKLNVTREVKIKQNTSRENPKAVLVTMYI